MADKEKKDDAEEQERDEAGEDEESTSEETSESAADEESAEEESSEEEAEEEAKPVRARARGAKKAAAKVEADDEPAEEEEAASASEDEEEGEPDAAAQRVAEALGVDDGEAGEDEAKADAEEAPAIVNRASRRREEALERRRKRKGKGAAKTADAGIDAELPRDKNARAKELLKRRREQAADPRPINLLPGEMVDDALARSASATSKWVKDNFSKLQWVLLAGIAAAIGFALYTSQTEKSAAAATDELASGVAAEHGKVMAEDKRSDEEKDFDPAKIYKTADERTEAALAAYRKTQTDHPATAAALLAKLGEAGVLLDKRDWQGAIDAYGAVLASKLSGADADVKGRAIEGVGLAKEGKGDVDGAMASFKELQSIDERGFKELGMYHEARMLLVKGDKDKAKDLLKQVHDKLAVPTTEGKTSRFLETVVDEALRRLDPNAIPAKEPAIGGPKGNAMSADQLEKLKRMLQQAGEKKGAPEEH